MSTTPLIGQILNCKDKLYRFALRLLGSSAEAEDVVQEVLLISWRKRQDLLHIQNGEAWSMRVVKNLSLDKLRAKCNQAHAQVEELELRDSQRTPQDLAEVNDLMDWVRKEISGLSDKQRMVIQLRDVEGYSYQEIAEILELTLSQVKVNLFRARKAIRERVMKVEHFSQLPAFVSLPRKKPSSPSG